MNEPIIIQVYTRPTEQGDVVFVSVTLTGYGLSYKVSLEQALEPYGSVADVKDKVVVFRVLVTEDAVIDNVIGACEVLSRCVTVIDTRDNERTALWLPDKGMAASYR